MRRASAHVAVVGRSTAGVLVLFCCFLSVDGRAILQAGKEVGKGEEKRGVFLSDALPLRVEASSPPGLFGEKNTVLSINEEQAFTVVFSRSVINFAQTKSSEDPFTLDPPVPGRFTWPRKYIVKWKPDRDWPLDNVIKLKWNEKFKSYDGIFLVSGAEKKKIGTVTLKTPSLGMSLAKVISDESNKLTGNSWDPRLGLSEDFLPEVPPDGKIILQFSHPVSLKMLRDQSKIMEQGKRANIGIKAEPCDSSNSQLKEVACAAISFTSPLKVATRYSLVLEVGVTYSRNAGALTVRSEVFFGGLREFKIPFLELAPNQAYSVDNRALAMWLPHGLSEKTKLSVLAKEISVIALRTGRKLSFELKVVNRSILQLTAPLEPDQSYRIVVSSSSRVTDGFGLQLKGSSILIETKAVEPGFEPVQPSSRKLSIFEASEDWGREVSAMYQGNLRSGGDLFCSSAPNVTIWSLSSDSDVANSLSLLQANSAPQSLTENLGSPDDVLVHKKSSGKKANQLGFGGVDRLDISALIEKRGALATQTCRSSIFDYHLTVESEVQVAVVSGKVDSSAWVTSLVTGKPLKGATVTLYKLSVDGFQNELVEGEMFEVVSKGVSDESGIALLLNATDGLHASVEYGETLSFVPSIVPSATFANKEIHDVIILDREIVKPGETLVIKGYAVIRDGGDLVPAQQSVLTGTVLSISPPLNGTNGSNRFPVSVSGKHGGYQLEVPIPLDVPLTSYTVQFEAAELLGSFERFIISKPLSLDTRLTVTAPFWARPTQNVTVDVSLRSRIHSLVVDTDLQASWTISADPTATTKDAEIRGRANISTNADGDASFEIDLAALETPPSPGSILAVFLQWVGPSREKHEARKIVRLEVADVSISLRETVSTHLPGQPFGVIALVTDLKRNPSPVEVALHLKKVPNSIVTFARDSNKRLRGPVERKCNLIAGDLNPTCRLVLPDMGRYIMEACIQRNGTTVCHRKPIGRPASSWRKKPLDFFAPVGLMALSEGPYEVPGPAEFAIENPYTDSYALLTWGSRLGSRQEVIRLKNRRLVNFTLELGEECLGDCGLSVVVAVPRQKSAIFSEVPVSKLFDPLLPHIQTMKRTISVLQNRSVEVDISFPSLKNERKAVAAPGQNLTVSVKVEPIPASVSYKSAEITVVAVEVPPKTLQDESPIQAENLASRFKLNLAVDFETTDTSKLLVPPKTMKILMDTYLRRKGEDPWAPMLSSEFGPSEEGTTVALSEQEYLNLFQDPITKIPTSSVEPIEAFSYGSTAGESPKKVPPAKATEESVEPELLWKGNRHLEEISVSPPLFETKTVEGGRADFSFIVPEKPGKYVVRAYVSAGSPIRFGNMERELTVRKPLMISPFCPPFARVGDILEAGIELRVLSKVSRVKVRAVVAKDSDGMVKVLGPSTAQDVDLVDFRGKASFRFKSLSAGNATIKFIGEIKGGEMEQVVTHLPILDSQDEMQVFEVDAVQAKGSVSLVDLHDFPKGKASVNITMGILDLPSFVSFSKDVINQNPGHKCPISAESALSLCVARFVTDEFAAAKFSNRESVGLFAGIRTNFTAAVSSLTAMTNAERGLETVKPCGDDGAPSLAKTTLILSNARAIWIVKEVERLNDTSKAKVNATGDFFKLAESWRSALERQLVSEAGVLRAASNSSIDPALVAISRAALVVPSRKLSGRETKAREWKPPEDTDKQIVRDLSMERLRSSFGDLDVESQAYVLLADHELDKKFVDRGIESWVKMFRSGTTSGYVPIQEGSQTPASYAANSLVLIVLLRAEYKGASVVEQLANFIRSPPLDPSGLKGVREIDRAVAMLALRTYDRARESKVPNVEVMLKNGRKVVANTTLTTSSDPVFWTSVVDGLDSTTTSLVASIKGKGMLSIAISASYIPKTTPLQGPIYQGILVEQSIQKVGGGEPLTVVPESSILMVEVDIVVTEDLPETVVRVMVPGGLEPIEYVAINGGAKDGCAKDLDSLELNCATQKIEPTLVTFEFKGLAKGTHSAYFHAVATTVGRFSVPPVVAFVAERREIMGSSRGGTLKICKKDESGSCDFVKRDRDVALIGCRGNCNRNGACDLSTGGCRCRNGFTGIDCGVFDGK